MTEGQLLSMGPDGRYQWADAPQPPAPWVVLTQAEFDQLDPPDPDTLYIIVEAS